MEDSLQLSAYLSVIKSLSGNKQAQSMATYLTIDHLITNQSEFMKLIDDDCERTWWVELLSSLDEEISAFIAVSLEPEPLARELAEVIYKHKTVARNKILSSKYKNESEY